MKHLKIAPLVILVFIILLMSFTTHKRINDKQNNDIENGIGVLQLDGTTVIIPILENEDSKIESEKYIRTLKVQYSDKLDKPIRLRNGDKIYNRCSYQSHIKFYSESDSLSIESWKRMSCEVVAFFNLTQRDSEWLKTYRIKKIKIRNLSTDCEFTFEDFNSLYLKEMISKYNKTAKL